MSEFSLTKAGGLTGVVDALADIGGQLGLGAVMPRGFWNQQGRP
jgi:hypothetical protein